MIWKFTIEQYRYIIKTNTIGGLINEYIKRYVDNYFIQGDVLNRDIRSSNCKDFIIDLSKEQLNEAVKGLWDYVVNNYALSTDILDILKMMN